MRESPVYTFQAAPYVYRTYAKSLNFIYSDAFGAVGNRTYRGSA